MGEKTDKKREYIMAKATEVFVKKGFLQVTMKDIVEACQISRGGLYLYFGSTGEVFQAIISRKLEQEGDDLPQNPREMKTMADILLLFLKEQKKLILQKKEDLTIATYEYLFSRKLQDETGNLIKNQFKAGIAVLTKILEQGVARGEFYCEDPGQAACGIMYTLEGMKICSKTMGIKEGQVDRQLLYMVSGLLIEEE